MTRILITSALPYINGVKHLGNLVGSMLPADVYARFQRQRGYEVLYICATDEHGTPAELAALESGLPVEEFCRQQYEIQADIYKRFNLSFDYFGRSSSPQNVELTQHFHSQLDKHGYIEEKVIKQILSIDDNRFLPDRYIIGTCPHCGYEAARGDQCESCTKLLDPADLIDPRSAISGSKNLEVKETKHLFLKQSQLARTIQSWIEQHTDWPVLVQSIAMKWLNEGLLDRCITRDLSWGVPVNRQGYEGKVFYVWFDAPIEYIGATKAWADQFPDKRDWKSWWYDASEVRYVQFMAKDNIPFHTVSFPCTIIGSGEPWKLPDYIKGFNWLNFYGGKFSTSRKHGIFMDKAIEEYPADYWRYYLMANAPESSDTVFKFSSFANTVNKDLADVLGNFVNRTLKFVESKFGAAVPDGGDFDIAENELAAELSQRFEDYTKYLEEMQFRKALVELRAIWVLGNNYLTHAAPWSIIKTDKERAAVILRTAINLIRIFAILSLPIIPATSENICDSLNLPNTRKNWLDRPMIDELKALAPGHVFKVPGVLFKKIGDSEVKILINRYGGEEE